MMASTPSDHTFRRAVTAGIALMTPREKWLASVTALSILVNSFLQTGVLIGVVPIVQSMIDISSISRNRLFIILREALDVQDDTQILIGFGLFLIVMLIVRTAYGYVHIRWITEFSRRCETRMGSMVMRQVVRSPYEWHLQQSSERIREIIFGHTVHWSRDFIRMGIQIANDATFVLFVVAALAIASPLLGLVTICVLVLLAWSIFAAVRKRLVELAQIKRDALIRAHVINTETVRGIKDVKMAGVEDRHVEKFIEQLMAYSGADARGIVLRQMPRLLLELIAFGTLVVISCAVVATGVQGSDVAGIFVLYALAALRVLPMITNLVASLGTMVSSLPMILELHQLVRTTDPAVNNGELDTARRDGWNWKTIRLHDISYSYPTAAQHAISGVNLTIENGRSYGIVGPSGAGKSTLIDVIAGLVEPSAGVLQADEHVISGAEARLRWRARFGYVAQRPFILDATLQENIVFGFHDVVDEARLARAIDLACLGNVVRRLPGGLDGRVGEQGGNLSGGERQRVAIARALFRGAEVLILDEATSSLDVLIEREVRESLTRLKGEVTTIIVSHRLNLVRDCDEIWVADESRVADVGSHEALLERSLLYARMCEA